MLAAAQVAAAVQAALLGLPSTGARVFLGRRHPVTEDELPCWLVAKGDEDIQAEGLHWPGRELHTLELSAIGVVRDTEDLELAQDLLAAEGLAGLFGAAPPPFELVCTGIERPESSRTEGEGAVGLVTLKLRALFFTLQNDPETIL